MGDGHAQVITQAKTVPQPMTAQRMRTAVVPVIVVLQRSDMDQPFCRQFDALDKQAELLNAGHHAIQLFANPLAEVIQQFHFDQFPFGLFGALLALRAVIAQRGQFLQMLFGFPFGQQGVQQAVDGQVRVAADGGGKVAVAVAGQCIMAFLLWAVDRLLHAAEHGVV